MKNNERSLAAAFSLFLGVLLIAAAGCAGSPKEGAAAPESAKPATTAWTFDDATALPEGWTVQATRPKGALATWAVAADDAAPSKPGVLSLSEVHDTARGVYNLCWTDGVKFKDGAVEVKVRGNTGKVDQGGGPIWRVRDADNYYIARFNPLEDNFRVYVVKDGVRSQLDSAEGISIPAGQWFTIKIAQNGDRIEGWLNGEKKLEATDATFPNAGGVGVWTKADAATSFDDFQVTPDGE